MGIEVGLFNVLVSKNKGTFMGISTISPIATQVLYPIPPPRLEKAHSRSFDYF